MQVKASLWDDLRRALSGWLGSQNVVHWFQTSGIRIAIIIIAAIVVNAVLRRIAAGAKRKMAADGVITEEEKRLATVIGLTQRGITVLVSTLALAMILDQVGVPIGPLLASAGVAGLAIGFGAQNLVRDVVSGFFILVENQYREGDVIEAAGVSGRVEHFGIRATVLRDVMGRVHYIPNGEIKVMSNLTQGRSSAVIDIGVTYREDVDRVLALLKQLCVEMRTDPAYSARIFSAEVPGIERLDDSAVILRVVVETVPLQQWEIAREFRRRLLAAFKAQGIDIPFPSRTLYMGAESERKLPVG
jgi:small conductance mechanosensitive channel